MLAVSDEEMRAGTLFEHERKIFRPHADRLVGVNVPATEKPNCHIRNDVHLMQIIHQRRKHQAKTAACCAPERFSHGPCGLFDLCLQPSHHSARMCADRAGHCDCCGNDVVATIGLKSGHAQDRRFQCGNLLGDKRVERRYDLASGQDWISSQMRAGRMGPFAADGYIEENTACTGAPPANCHLANS